MARRDALLRLHKALVGRRDELRRRLGGELNSLLTKTVDTGDAADMAFDAGSEEVASQLAEIESRELTQIERSLARLKQGTYGVCEGCQKKIPVARLNALPFITTCIQCQHEVERYGGNGRYSGVLHWDKLDGADRPLEDQREVSLSQIEMDIH